MIFNFSFTTCQRQGLEEVRGCFFVHVLEKDDRTAIQQRTLLGDHGPYNRLWSMEGRNTKQGETYVQQ